MLKVVFDTVIFVRSLLNPYSMWGIAVFRYTHLYRLFVSPPVLLEYLEVLHREELVQRFRTLRGLDSAQVIELLGRAEMVEIGEPPMISRDLKDNKFLATAEAAQADYLVTEDQDLLVLNEYQATKIIAMETFLAVLEREGVD